MDTFTCGWNLPEPYKCDQCQFETSMKVSLLDHIRVLHKGKESSFNFEQILGNYECENCDFQTFSLLLLTKHKIWEQGWDKTVKDVLEESRITRVTLIPAKSRAKYEAAYKAFMDWRSINKINSFSENDLLAYFGELSEKIKSSSLASLYFMLRSTLKIYNNINIQNYWELRSWLKRKRKGYQAQKTKRFTSDMINKFFSEAPDHTYLATKVVAIMRMVGGCSKAELHSMNIEHIQDFGSTLLVTVHNRDTKAFRQYKISDRLYQICKKYMNLRPSGRNCTNSFFLNYKNGKCRARRIGIKKFTMMGKQIAKFLNLPNPELYVGPGSFPNLLLNEGGDGRSNSAPVVEVYVDEPMENKINSTTQNSHTANGKICSTSTINFTNDANQDTMTIINGYKDDSIKTETDTEIGDLNKRDIETKTEILQSDHQETSRSLIPEKSRVRYEAVYKSFMDWRSINKVDSFTENDLLAYFRDLSEKYGSSTLWTHYSILRNTLNINNKINIWNYSELRLWLKRKGEGYKAKRTKVFTPDEINKFLKLAPDKMYLAVKVALIMGIVGACRGRELHSISVKDVQDLGSVMSVTVRKNKVRKFTLTGYLYQICKKYIDLRPTDPKCSTPFFLHYRNGVCTIRRIGIHKFRAMGKQIAKFLKLKNPEMYTGLSFPKSSDNIVVDESGNITALTKQAEWTYTTEEITDDSVKNEIDSASEMDDSIKNGVDTDNEMDDLIKSEIDIEEETPVYQVESIPTKNKSVADANELPEKSRSRYEKTYKAFMDWRDINEIDSFSEDVLFKYFQELSEKLKSSTLWAHYSMLRSTLILNHNTNIENYSKLRLFLKRKGEGYQTKKAKIFTPDEINKFLYEAPDNIYLATKVALIMGIIGRCRKGELHSLNIGDVENTGSSLLVTVHNTDRKATRQFTISGYFHKICEKYIYLRPANPHGSFFLNFNRGRCTTRRIGVNTFGAMGKQIAKFLKLPNPEMYTGLSFRRSSQFL